MARNKSEKKGRRERIVSHPNQDDLDLVLDVSPDDSKKWRVSLTHVDETLPRRELDFDTFAEAFALFDRTPETIWWPPAGGDDPYGWVVAPPRFMMRDEGMDDAT